MAVPRPQVLQPDPTIQVPASARVAVLVPCYNEGLTIASVVSSFRQALPQAEIYVYDNNSRDNTREVAAQAGAIVRTEPLQGKGHVVRRMFSDIDADAYVMVDGDDTYDAAVAPQMVALLFRDCLDMVVGRRIDEEVAAYRPGHRFGNAMLTGTVSRLFGDRFEDMLSGYRVFSRRYVKSFPVFTHEFEIETEITVHTLTLNLPAAEVPTTYKSRPEGSTSKLRTYRDGVRILSAIFYLMRAERPLLFFSATGILLLVISLVLAYPLFLTFLETGLVPRFPTAILSTGLALLAFLSLTCGFILDTVTRGRREVCMLSYLSIPRWEGADSRAHH